jgi:inner membrane protein
VQLDLADSRIHTIERRRVMPTLGNLVVWRSVYQAKGLLQADMIRLPAQGVATYRPGERLMLRVSKDRPQPPADSVLARDIARFTWFSDGFIAPVGGDLNLLGDMRYSLESHRFRPLWAIRIDPARPDQHVTIEYLRRSDARDSIDQLLRDIWYQNPDDPLVDDIGVVETPRRRP